MQVSRDDVLWAIQTVQQSIDVVLGSLLSETYGATLGVFHPLSDAVM